MHLIVCSVQIINRLDKQSMFQMLGGAPRKLDGGVRRVSQIPYPIYDQNLRFRYPVYDLMDQKFDNLFMTVGVATVGLNIS